MDCPPRSSSEFLEDNGIEDDEADGGGGALKDGVKGTGPTWSSLDAECSKTEEEKVCEIDRCMHACMGYVRVRVVGMYGHL